MRLLSPGRLFQGRALGSLLDAATKTGRVRMHVTGGSERVVVPPLAIGTQMAARIPIRETCSIASGYDSSLAWICEILEAEVYGSAGMICVGDAVVSDRLAAGAHDHVACEDGIRPLVSGVRHVLSGTTLSLLGPAGDNYYHWTVDGLGGLAAASRGMRDTCANVLVPPLACQYQRDGLRLCGLASKRVLEIGPGDCVAAERLLVPCDMAADWRPHPNLQRFFHSLGRSVSPDRARSFPQRVYIDRRGSGNRRLDNEEDVVRALDKYGVVPIRLETMSLVDQIGVFGNARLVVAPHGAGLTNVLFATRQCALIELQMNIYVHPIFRLFAAMGGVQYDHVLGIDLPGGPDYSQDEAAVHGRSWTVSVTHVLGAVERFLR